jgi:hypothetical protein
MGAEHTIANDSSMGIVISPRAEVTLLDVEWSVYRALVEQPGDHGRSRLAYDGAVLEIVSPSRKHEVCCRLIEALIS